MISSTRYTPVNSWSNRTLLSGVTAVVHGCSIHALGPIRSEFTQTGGGRVLGVYHFNAIIEYPAKYSCEKNTN